ncbi:MAG: NFACT RNA binding domain-containing protein [Cyanobacteria bacterium P01_F01_bin.86]
MQPVDFTTLMATCAELRNDWLPARCEQVVQRDRTTICIALRTLQQRAWLTISWHSQAARIHIGDPPPRTPDTFTFSQQLKHQLNSYALVAIEPVAPWERVLDLQFARRPGDPIQWHLYVEVMGKYSNVILTNAQNQIVTAAHQVTEQQSSVRQILTGAPYVMPPAIAGPFPSLEESQERWQERVSLLPTTIKKALFKAYSGLSSALVRDLTQRSGLDPHQSVTQLSSDDWQQLFEQWQLWLRCLQTGLFQSGFTQGGYSVFLDTQENAPSVQSLLREYYAAELNLQEYDRLKNQLGQRLKTLLKKLRHKEDTFRSRWDEADEAEQYRQRADLLMAYSHQWQPGIQQMVLAHFETGEPVEIPVDPEKTAIQMAQTYYKRHRKLKRSRQAIAPLLREVRAEVNYLEQVDAALKQIEQYETEADLAAVADIRDELIQQGYLEDSTYRPSQNRSREELAVRKFVTPGRLEVWVGRNNRQNDLLISQVATDYDLWFHTQEIPGSHVLLRLQAGQPPTEQDLQFTADIAAYFSRAQQADQVPVIYTQPQYVFKPKGARPGMVVYTHETVMWGQPQATRKRLDGELSSQELASTAR